MEKILIIGCKRTMDDVCIGCSRCLVGFNRREGFFELYADVEAEVIGLLNCGDCPGTGIITRLAQVKLWNAPPGRKADRHPPGALPGRSLSPQGDPHRQDKGQGGHPGGGRRPPLHSGRHLRLSLEPEHPKFRTFTPWSTRSGAPARPGRRPPLPPSPHQPKREGEIFFK